MKKLSNIHNTKMKILVLIAILSLVGCKKFITVPTPVANISTESAFKNESTATSVLTGILVQMEDNYLRNIKLGSLSVFGDVSSDNLTVFDVNNHVSPDYATYYLNQITPSYQNQGIESWWKSTYEIMYSINFSIEQLEDNAQLKSTVANRLLGEAYFLRAFHYFYMVNLYGGIPLVLTTNYKTNATLPRSTEAEVYSQILSDLSLAESLLNNNYVGGNVETITTERVRPNLATVNALKARVFLYLKRYAEAEQAASKVIAQSSLFSLNKPEVVFLKNSNETIWALQPVTSGYNSYEASFFTLPAAGPSRTRPVYLSISLLNSFEPGDERRVKWVTNLTVGAKSYSYAAKYKVPFGATTVTEYPILFRLAEQYLIRAEARNEQDNITGAIDDLNALRIRSRATSTASIPNPLPNLPMSLNQSQVRMAVMQERRVELFTEWGHRWFDLKRTGTMDAVLTTAASSKGNGAVWASYKALYPIPAIEIQSNPSLSQNPGYIN